MAAPLSAVPLARILRCRGSLPSLAARLHRTDDSLLRVAYLGGSVTEQKAGWRPRVNDWLSARTGRGVEEVRAFCGNCGSKVFAFMVDEWVVARAPHLLFVELAINDGDTLLESGGDAHSLGCALEGLLRRVREALPLCEVVVLLMFVRDDLPLHARTGSKAWSDNADAAAVAAYHETVPALHAAVAAHYGLPCIDLVPLFSALPPAARAIAFRDDCHHTEAGAALAAAAVCHCLDELCGGGGGGTPAPLPAPLRADVWPAGRARRVSDRELSCFYMKSAPADAEAARRRLLARHVQLDVDPLNPTQQGAWFLVYPGDVAEVHFEGSRLGLLTMVGPDSGTVVCDVDGGRWSARRCLLDRWAYFWRLSVVLLVEGLDEGPHVARTRLEEARPDASVVLKRRPEGEHWARCVADGKDHKLWLSFWLIG